MFFFTETSVRESISARAYTAGVIHDLNIRRLECLVPARQFVFAQAELTGDCRPNPNGRILA
jgi:hypothetical protein